MTGRILTQDYIVTKTHTVEVNLVLNERIQKIIIGGGGDSWRGKGEGRGPGNIFLSFLSYQRFSFRLVSLASRGCP